MILSSLPLKMDVPCGNRTHNYSLGGYCYIHLTKGTNGFATETYYNKVRWQSQENLYRALFRFQVKFHKITILRFPLLKQRRI